MAVMTNICCWPAIRQQLPGLPFVRPPSHHQLQLLDLGMQSKSETGVIWRDTSGYTLSNIWRIVEYVERQEVSCAIGALLDVNRSRRERHAR